MYFKFIYDGTVGKIEEIESAFVVGTKQSTTAKTILVSCHVSVSIVMLVLLCHVSVVMLC